jgi:hypothetical protein
VLVQATSWHRRPDGKVELIPTQPSYMPDFSRDLENPSPNLSPTRREALIFPPSLSPTRCANAGKGVRGLGLTLAFPHNVKSQSYMQPSLTCAHVAAGRSNLF